MLFLVVRASRSLAGYPAESGSGVSRGRHVTQLGAARYWETCRNAVNTIFRREDACLSLSTRQRKSDTAKAMTRSTFAIVIAFLCSLAAAEQPTVTFVSPCECHGFHGKNRWVTKTDLSPLPADKSAIQSITPSQIYAWEGLGLDVDLTGTTEERMPSEQKSYALTGRVVDWHMYRSRSHHAVIALMM